MPSKGLFSQGKRKERNAAPASRVLGATMRTLTTLALVGFCFPAVAGTLNNQDSREYRLHMKSSGGDQAFPINTSTRVEHTCNAFPCVVENEDTGEKVKLTCGDENLIIKDGHLAISMTDVAPAGGAVAVAAAPAAAPSKPAKASKSSKAEKPAKHAAKAKASKSAKHARAAKHKKGSTVAMAE
jgi:hypothetical protein